eukprot:scaffold26772_cov57-Phaeocystis_antarctica.AAC.1
MRAPLPVSSERAQGSGLHALAALWEGRRADDRAGTRTGDDNGTTVATCLEGTEPLPKKQDAKQQVALRMIYELRRRETSLTSYGASYLISGASGRSAFPPHAARA